ncbi:MAG TPA: hypothetical protein VG167_03520 [Verrucomicrobiae bacterium]|nr:hypothetical protein [Verrucomicrobiae bacterium]
MKTCLRTMTIALLLLGSFETQLCLFAEVTAFTYQGRLNTDTGSANGLYDFTFSIYDQPTGTGLFAIQTNLATQVSNGLFTVTIDFGPVVTKAIFSGPARWLEIAARTNGAAAYATLSPRQPFTAAPYAITAANLAGGGANWHVHESRHLQQSREQFLREWRRPDQCERHNAGRLWLLRLALLLESRRERGHNASVGLSGHHG